MHTTTTRRTFLAASAGFAALAITRPSLLAHQATPIAEDFPLLEIELNDAGLVIPEGIQAGRYLLAATNTGTQTESHWAMGKFPDDVTEDDIAEFFAAQDNTEKIAFEEIGFVGVPDWPQPGQPAVTGIVDLQPGRYMAFMPFYEMLPTRFTVEGVFPDVTEPVSDLEVDLHEMQITIPETAFTSEPRRWKITNTGGIPHDVAVLPVSEDFTADVFMTLMSLPEDATPPPGTPNFAYLPVEAIGILQAGGTSWLDVQLAPGHYMAVCMLPFGTGYPHGMDGMFVFFDVA